MMRRSVRRLSVVAAFALLVPLTAGARQDDAWVCNAYDQSAKRGRNPAAEGYLPYPLVTIHGITGSDDDFDHTIDMSFNGTGDGPQPPRSLLTALAGAYVDSGETLPPGLPGVHVYSFSYTEESLTWVDEPKVGGKFAKTIDCLYDLNRQPVIVVAHSMGGLVTRWVANTTDAQGRPRSDKIAKVITLGTPYEGSYMSSIANGATDIAGIAVPGINLIRQLCGTRSTNSGKGNCGVIPSYGSATSRAGQNLMVGSSALRALEPWPDDVEVATLAGSQILPLGLLGSPVNTSVEIGDLAVGRASATADPGEGRAFECRYDTAAGSLGAALKRILLISDPRERNRRLTEAFIASPCYHSNLMRNVDVTNEVLGQVSDWLDDHPAPEAPTNVAELSSEFVSAVIEGRPAAHLASPDALDAALQLQDDGVLPSGEGYRVEWRYADESDEVDWCELVSDATGVCELAVLDADDELVALVDVTYALIRETDGLEYIDGSFYTPDGELAMPDMFHPQVVGIE